MAVYTLDTTNRTTLFNSLIAALQNAGVYGTTLSQSSSDLYFTLSSSRSAYYFRLNLSDDTNKRPSFYYGTGYSGGALVNSQTVQSVGTDTWPSYWVIVGQYTVAMMAKNSGVTQQICWFITETEDTTTEVIGSLATTGTATVRWTPTHAAIFMASPAVYGAAATIKATAQYYARARYILVDSTYVVLTTAGLIDMWALCRHPSLISGLEVYGDDAVLCSGNVSSPATANVVPPYILNGYSWSPS